MLRDKRFSHLMSLMEASSGVDPAWFGVGVLLHRPYAYQRLDFLKYLEKNGVENRPIISGNFIRQPCIATFCEQEHPENYPGAETIHTRGFFIGIHQITLEQAAIEKLVDIILAFPFHPQHVVLVTGSHSMLGRYIRDVVFEQALKEETVPTSQDSMQQQITTKDSEWIFLSRDDGDLRNIEDVSNIFKRFQLTRILHCAAHLASTHDMSSRPVDFWLDNVTLNNNILQAAFQFQAWCGPIKVVSMLSTDIFLEHAQSLLNPSTIFDRPLRLGVEAYAHAKLSLVQLTQWYRQQHNCSFISVLVDNVFGAYGDSNSDADSFVNSLIVKILRQEENNPTVPVVIVNTSAPESQILFARDLANILIWTMDNYDEDDTLLVTGEKVSVTELIQLVCEQANFHAGYTLETTVNTNSFSYRLGGFRRLK